MEVIDVGSGVGSFSYMQEADRSAADLREMAKKCRLLAGQLLDERSAASLRNLAEEYDEAADAAEQRIKLNGNGHPRGD
jgi:hypothetical protein